MTNYEYWKGIIQAIWDKKDRVGVNGKEVPCGCNRINCDDCIVNNNGYNCQETVFKWLMAEHVDKPKLTKKERQFCELIEVGYIARDSNEQIFHFKNKPIKRCKYWKEETNEYSTTNLRILLGSNDYFDFIKWEDKEPWSIEDLLKLDVVGETK